MVKSGTIRKTLQFCTYDDILYNNYTERETRIAVYRTAHTRHRNYRG